MNDLPGLRTRIDALDTELLRLLNERATLAREIGVIKTREDLPIYSPDREMKLLRNLVERSNGPLRPESIRAIYREIMSASLALENDVVIASFGPPGSPSHRAALGKFGSSVRYQNLSSVEEVFGAVSKNQADCGVVPLEDPEAGFSMATFDELSDTELTVCAEIETGESEGGARFLVIGRHVNSPTDADATLLMLRLDDRPGALVTALEPFRQLQVNLSQFASRPARKGSEDLLFFVQAEGHRNHLQETGLLRELSKNCRSVKILGSFPRIRP